VRNDHRLPRLDVARGHKAAVSAERFLDAVAERTPAPGGGAAAALACALGAALVEMAARFASLDDAVARASALRAEAQRLGEEDLAAYAPVLEALALPRDDPSRAGRVRDASSAAAEVPLAVAEAAASVAELARAVAAGGRPALRGDALAGADIAAGAARAAARLVEINLTDVGDDGRVVRAGAAVTRAAG
jgi:formiminotetrahydrofolate cyclodeaminase